MDNKAISNVLLEDYTLEGYLPCELNEVISHVREKRIIDSYKTQKIGLNEDIVAIPLYEGYLLYTKKLLLVINNLKPLFQINGTHVFSDLITTTEMESCLHQSHYYNLLSFGSNKGRINEVIIDQKIQELYKNGEFVNFSFVPLTVELDITDNCNFGCIHCQKDSGFKKTSKDNLSTTELLTIIDNCARIGVPELILLGGEPLMHPDFFDLVKSAKRKGIRNIRTSTNGWNVNEKTAKELAKYFDNIQISIHGASAATHDKIVKRDGAWEQAKKAITILKENNIKVDVTFTVMRENVNDLKKMPHLIREWGVESLRFLRLFCQGRGSLLKGWCDEEIVQIANEIKRINRNCEILDAPYFKIDVGGFPPLNPIKNDANFYGCTAGRTLLHIASNGQVNACGSIEGNYIGKIRGIDILDIWHSPEFIELRRQLDCDCNYRPICSGPCKAD